MPRKTALDLEIENFDDKIAALSQELAVMTLARKYMLDRRPIREPRPPRKRRPVPPVAKG